MMDRLGPTNLLVFLAMTPHAAASQGLPSKEALAVPVAGSGDVAHRRVRCAAAATAPRYRSLIPASSSNPPSTAATSR